MALRARKQPEGLMREAKPTEECKCGAFASICKANEQFACKLQPFALQMLHLLANACICEANAVFTEQKQAFACICPANAVIARQLLAIALQLHRFKVLARKKPLKRAFCRLKKAQQGLRPC